MKRLTKKELYEIVLSTIYEESPDMANYIAKNYDAIMLDDGLIIEFRKPSIDRKMYYPDHLKEPSHELKSFINYNMFYNFNDTLLKWQNEMIQLHTIGCCSGRYNTKLWLSRNYAVNQPFASIYCSSNIDYNDELYVRELSEKEEKEIIDFVKTLKKEYTKRLETYYKRYSNKIHAIGYWADR